MQTGNQQMKIASSTEDYDVTQPSIETGLTWPFTRKTTRPIFGRERWTLGQVSETDDRAYASLCGARADMGQHSPLFSVPGNLHNASSWDCAGRRAAAQEWTTNCCTQGPIRAWRSTLERGDEPRQRPQPSVAPPESSVTMTPATWREWAVPTAPDGPRLGTR